MSRKLWAAVLLTAAEDALLGPVQARDRAAAIILCEQARAYLTRPSKDLAEVCALAGLDMEPVIDRMRKQIAQAPTPEELADKPRKSAAIFTKAPAKPKHVFFRDREFTIRGETRTASEWCAIFDTSAARASQRIAQGWGAERAFTLTVEEAKAEALEQSRRSYGATTKIAEVQHGDRQVRRQRRRPPIPPKLYEHDGQERSLPEWSRVTGIKLTTLDKRLRSGWTIKDAITTPTRVKAA